MTEASAGSPPAFILTRVFGIRRDELAAIAWSFSYFFCLLAAYYILRPVRETMATISGAETIPYLFTGTFVTMMIATPIFGWVASRFPRKTFLPWVYYFFIVNIIVFYLAFLYTEANDVSLVWIARAFFVWLSVFNLFVVSVFWSFMADIYTKEQSRRLFGVISAGGSTGAILGPLVTSFIAEPIGTTNLLPISAVLLAACVGCVQQLRRWTSEHETGAQREAVVSDQAMGGRAVDGIKFVFTSPYFGAIAIALFLTNFLGGTLYFYYIALVQESSEVLGARTEIFARLDAITGFLSLIVQALVVRVSVKRLGVGFTLAVVPAISVIGFALFALNPVFAVLATLQALRRAIGFGLTKPTTDMLYAVVTPEERYKAKNFVETAIYRGSDVVTAWIVRLLNSFIGVVGVALVCVPLAIIGAGLAHVIGRQYRKRDAAISRQEMTT